MRKKKGIHIDSAVVDLVNASDLDDEIEAVYKAKSLEHDDEIFALINSTDDFYSTAESKKSKKKGKSKSSVIIVIILVIGFISTLVCTLSVISKL